MLTVFLITSIAVCFASADYSCLCSYHVEREVYAKPDVISPVVGYLYEFDCKAVVAGSHPDLGTKWAVIAFEHQMGYVLTDAEITKQICPGSPSPMDSVTTLPTTTSVPNKSTVSSVPSTQSSASIMQSTKPTTQGHTTPKKTTTPTTQSTTSSTQRTTSITQSTTSTTQSTTSTTQSTTSTTESSTAKEKSTIFTMQSTKATTQSTNPTTQSTKPTSQSASTTSTTQSTKATTQSTKVITQSSKPTSKSTTSTTQSTTPTTQSTTPTVKAKTTVLHHLLTTHNKQATTDWTIVPWSTAHSQVHNHQKTTQHAPYHQQTTQSSFHHINNTVNVGNLNLCPRTVVRLQVPGTRNLRQHGQFCYELRRDAPADWVHASEDCFSYANGFMVQIMSQKDQDFIMQFLREEKVRVPIWIGLTDKGDEEHFYWDSGARLTYTNWDPQRKNNEAPHRQEDCGILKTDGQWDDTICSGFMFSDHHHPWICQYHVRHHGR